jgi:hypothetical protein
VVGGLPLVLRGEEDNMSDHKQPNPCPFCGATGLGFVPGDISEHPELDAEGMLNVCRTAADWFAVQCVGCYAMGPRVKASKATAYAKAIDAWNGRTLWA